MMRTDLTETIDGNRVRVVINALAWEPMLAGLEMDAFMRGLRWSDPRIMRRVLTAGMNSAGDLPPLKIMPEVDRLLDECPLTELGEFCMRCIGHALDKVDEASKNSHAAEAEEVATAAEPGTSSDS